MRRKTVLKSSLIGMSLPFLESFASKPIEKQEPKAKRLACIGLDLGFYQKAFFPKEAGPNYKPSRILKHIDSFRSDYSVFSGLDHRAGAGHDKWDNFLSGANFRTVSLDQIVADEIGQTTKYPSLSFTIGGVPYLQSLSRNKYGTPLPLIQRPSVFYNKIFSNPKNLKETENLLVEDRSAIDLINSDRKRLESNISKQDSQKLDEYFTSLREVERRLGQQMKYLHKKPLFDINYQLPEQDPVAPADMMEAENIMYDLLAIAFQLDITRVSAMFLVGLGQVFNINGKQFRTTYHKLSHHAGHKESIEQLIQIEEEHIKCFKRFLTHLKTKVDVQGKPLLNSTIVLLGTGMGDAHIHDSLNLPTLVAGGGFKKHGTHIANDKKKSNELLGNLFVNIQKQLGINKPFKGLHKGLKDWA